jgi:hypothetical protein
MARNKVQFQKGLSEAQFDELYGRLSTNLPALQEGAVPVMFALLDARSMTCG